MFRQVRQRDILMVPMPFSDLSGVKRRPVLVISNNIYNSKGSDFLAAAITSKFTERDYGVLLQGEDMEEGKLPLTSQIRADKIFSVSRERISAKFGRLKRETFNRVTNEVLLLIESK